MDRIRIYLILIISLLFLVNCEKKNITESEATGNIIVTVNLQPILHHYLPITRVTAQALVTNIRTECNLIIDSTFAIGTIPDLEEGKYSILVNVYSDSLLVATGTNTGTVAIGEDTPVQVEPEMSTLIYNRVLMVGNSHTYYNSGVDYHLQQLISNNLTATVTSCTQGGYTLENHYNDPTTISTIQHGNWDLVILQEASSTPVNTPEMFYQYARNLDEIIRAAGGKTGFFMTWIWKNNPEMYEPVVNAYNQIGAELRAIVAPCGIAFHNALQENALLGLYDADNYHPSLLGTFLASCVFYAAIWNLNPVDTEYVPSGIDSTTAIFLKQIAWNTVQEYQASKEQRVLDKIIADLPKAIVNREQELYLKAE